MHALWKSVLIVCIIYHEIGSESRNTGLESDLADGICKQKSLRHEITFQLFFSLVECHSVKVAACQLQGPGPVSGIAPRCYHSNAC